MTMTMKKMEKKMMAAIFTEVLPASLQQELKEKNYKVKVCKKHIKVSSARFYDSISYRFDEPSEEMLAFLHRYCAEDVDKTSTEYVNLFKEADLRSRVTPVTRDLRVEREMDYDGCEVESWLDTYVEYRIPLDSQDISGVIRAAKTFAGLE